MVNDRSSRNRSCADGIRGGHVRRATVPPPPFGPPMAAMEFSRSTGLNDVSATRSSFPEQHQNAAPTLTPPHGENSCSAKTGVKQPRMKIPRGCGWNWYPTDPMP
jgi:hypothetical protein